MPTKSLVMSYEKHCVLSNPSKKGSFRVRCAVIALVSPELCQARGYKRLKAVTYFLFSLQQRSVFTLYINLNGRIWTAGFSKLPSTSWTNNSSRLVSPVLHHCHQEGIPMIKRNRRIRFYSQDLSPFHSSNPFLPSTAFGQFFLSIEPRILPIGSHLGCRY